MCGESLGVMGLKTMRHTYGHERAPGGEGGELLELGDLNAPWQVEMRVWASLDRGHHCASPERAAQEPPTSEGPCERRRSTEEATAMAEAGRAGAGVVVGGLGLRSGQMEAIWGGGSVRGREGAGSPGKGSRSGERDPPPSPHPSPHASLTRFLFLI